MDTDVGTAGTTGVGVTDAGITEGGGIDVGPLLPVLGAGALGVSAAANLYSQYRSRQYYRAYEQDARRWVQDFQKNTGKSLRYPMLSMYGNAEKHRLNAENSLSSSVGTGAGALGAGAVALKKYLG